MVCFSVLIFCACFFGFQNTFADTAPFEIAGVELSQKSDTATGDVTGVDGNRINNNIVFHKVGDSVSYKITLKNVSGVDRVINNISSSSKGELFSYEFESHAGDVVANGDSFDFTLKMTYTDAVSDISKRQQNLEIKLIFMFSDGSSAEIIVVNPSTGDNIWVFGIILAVSAMGLASLIIVRAKKICLGKKVIVAVVALTMVCVSAPLVKAEDGFYDFSIRNAISLNDELVVRYLSRDGVTELKNETVAYGDYLQAPEVSDIEGYHFEGWLTEQGVLYDVSTPVAEDLVLTAKYAPYNYAIHFDGNGATGGSMADQMMAYDVPAALNTKSFIRAGYNFVEWNTAADGSGENYSDGETVVNLRNEPGIYNLFAIWEARNDTPYTVIDKFMTVNGEGYDTSTRTFVGTTDTDATPAPLSRDGFVSPQAQTKQIAGDGLMEIEYEYARVKKKLTIQDAQYVTSSHVSGEYNYGTQVTLKANDRDQWTFVKWSNDETDKEISITLYEDVTIKPIYEGTGFPVVFSHEGACKFNAIVDSTSHSNSGSMRADKISGDECPEYADQTYIDTGVQLYSEANAHKDFYIEFTIDEFDVTKNGGRATLLNGTQEVFANNYPGIVVRRNNNADQLMIGVNVVKDKVKTTNSKTYFTPASSVQRIRIVRKNDAICYAINNEGYVFVGDNTPHNQYFESPTVMFGAMIDESTGTSEVQRYLNGTLSGMIIRLGTDVEDTIDCSKD